MLDAISIVSAVLLSVVLARLHSITWALSSSLLLMQDLKFGHEVQQQ